LKIKIIKKKAKKNGSQRRRQKLHEEKGHKTRNPLQSKSLKPADFRGHTEKVLEQIRRRRFEIHKIHMRS